MDRNNCGPAQSLSKCAPVARLGYVGAYCPAERERTQSHEIHAVDLCGRGEGRAGRQGSRCRPDVGALLGLYRGPEEGRRHRRRRPAAADHHGDHGQGQRRQDQGLERPLCRDPGAARRLLHDRRAGSRRGFVLGGTLPRCRPWHGRGASALEHAGLLSGLVEQDGRAAAETAARRSYGKLLAYVAAQTRDVAAAEDALAEAFARALADWPKNGVPRQPEAWLLTAARRKAIDAARRSKSAAAGEQHLTMILDELAEAAEEHAEIPDRRLALMFACAHPAIDASVRAPLILQCVLGLDAAAIASAFLVAPATMAQRLVRAKTKIREAGIPFRVPEREALPERLGTVLDAIYATFAEGWADPGGADPKRRDLAGESIWLGRLVVELMPGEPEALGLLALMLHAEARRAARRDAEGRYVPLAEQEVARWNKPLIAEADAMLARAQVLQKIGRFQLEAAVQSAHAARRHLGR